MPRQAAATGNLPQAFKVVKEMQAGGPPARHPRRAAHPALLPDRGSEGLRETRPGDRPCDPGRRRSGALDPQGRRGPACPARAPGPGRDGEPGRRDPRPVGRRLPPPAAEERLQGGDARRRAREAGPGGAGDPPRRQEGDHRLPARRQREHRGTGALPRPAVPPRPDRRGPRDDLASMAARACSPPCRSSGTASPSGGAGRTGSATSSTGSASPTGRPSRPTSTPS